MAEVGCRPAAGLHDPRLARTSLGRPDGPGSLIRRTRAAAHGMARADALAAGGLPPLHPHCQALGATWLASLPQAATVAAPYTSFALRTAGQAGTAAVWPPPVGAVP